MAEKAGMTKPLITTAFILGAGLGTRLRPLTDALPKPLLPVGGRPLITYAMDHLRDSGVRRFIVNTHHLAHCYAEAFPEGTWRGIPITFRHEPVLLDTAGGLKNIEDLLENDERIWIYNGDILTNLPLGPLVERYVEKQPLVTLALRSDGPLVNVDIDSDGFICDMRGALGTPGVRRCLFAGIGIVEKAFWQKLSPGRIESVVLPLIESIRRDPRAVAGLVLDDGFWHDLGTRDAYDRIQTFFSGS